MNSQSIVSNSAENSPRHTSTPLIWAARLGWLLVLLLVVSLFFTNRPFFISDTFHEWHVGEAWPFARNIFSTRLSFARWLVFWRMVLGAIFLSTALLLAWRKWRDPVVLLFSADLLILGLFYSLAFNIDQIRFPDTMTNWVDNPGGFTLLLVFGAMLSLFYLFPDGRYQPRRWLWVARVVVINALLWAVLFGFPGISRTLEMRWPVLRNTSESGWYLFTGSLLAALVVGVVSQIVRYRRISSAEQRQQTKWGVIGLCAFLLFLAPTVGQSPFAFFISLHLSIFTFVLVPLTIAFSVLRYRLWEVDSWLNRTLVYGALTAVVILIYVLLVGGLGQLLRGDNLFLAVITTGLVALAINPLRNWLQKQVNRLLYGEQEDPLHLLAQLGAQLEATAEVDALLPTLVQTTATALKLPYVAVQLDDADAPLAAYGTPNGATELWPLLYQGVTIGRLQVAHRSPNETFSPREQRLLETIAHQAGAAAHAMQLSADLRQSRQRIVVAREEERRRLRRDLHDGLGPQLATLTLQIDAARNLIDRDPVSAESLLLDLKTGTQNAIAEIRRVVHDLRPSALDQLGLVGSLRQFAATMQTDTLTITVDAPETLPPLPAAVEVAAYRIAVEALTNISRHAHATVCTVQLRVQAGSLWLAIGDNGVGFSAETQPGVGLTSMRERSAELGGTLTIDTAHGVTITAMLPLDNLL